MNTTTTQPLTTPDLLTETQESTNQSFFSMLAPSEISTIPTFQELFANYAASLNKPEVAWNRLLSGGNLLENVHECSEASLLHPEPSIGSPLALSRDEAASPFAIYQHNLAQARPQRVRWLWEKRLPPAGITLLDGDHGCGKSLLALQIAAHVSSGTPMPDGSPTIQGGVIIVTPDVDATTTQKGDILRDKLILKGRDRRYVCFQKMV